MPASPSRTTAAARFRRLVHALRTEADDPRRQARAVGMGLFVGCTPFYGFHLAIVLVLASLLGVSRLTAYLAANISNPFMAPLLVFAEVQAGGLVRRGALHPLTVQELRTMDAWSFGGDLLAGALVVGLVLGAIGWAVTYLTMRRRRAPDLFDALAVRAADRYVDASITAREFGRGKLRGDPVYRDALLGGVLPGGGTLVDFGCGQGLMLALLLEAEAAWLAGQWTADRPPPRFAHRIGVEPRPGVVHLARTALGDWADIRAIDGRDFAFPACDAVLCFDVLQMVPYADQAALVTRVASALRPGGVLLVREADAGAGSRFRRVRIGNRAKALVSGRWRQTLCYRTEGEWLGLFAELGLEARVVPPSSSGHFGNVLFCVSAPAR